MNPFTAIPRRSVWDDQPIETAESHRYLSDDEGENTHEKLEWVKMNRDQPNKPFQGLNKALKTAHYEEFQKMLALEQDLNFIIDRFQKEKDSAVERVDEEDLIESIELNKQNQILTDTIEKMTKEIQDQRNRNMAMQKTIDTLNQQKFYKRMHLYIQLTKMFREISEQPQVSQAVPVILSRAVGTPVRVPICMASSSTSNTTTVSSGQGQTLQGKQSRQFERQLTQIMERFDGFLGFSKNM